MVLVLVGIAFYFAIRHHRSVTAWFQGCLAVVRGWWVRNDGMNGAAATDSEDHMQERALRFADLPNPIATYAEDPDHAIQALFEAACVWGREHRVERRDDETPEEFVARLGRKYSPIAEMLTRLGMVYSRLAYAQKRVPLQEAQSLESLWEWMVQHPTRRVS
jgi:hypothetical protein